MVLQFIYRHTELSLQSPEASSIARVCGFNKNRMYDFYNKLKMVNVQSGCTVYLQHG